MGSVGERAEGTVFMLKGRGRRGASLIGFSVCVIIHCLNERHDDTRHKDSSRKRLRSRTKLSSRKPLLLHLHSANQQRRLRDGPTHQPKVDHHRPGRPSGTGSGSGSRGRATGPQPRGILQIHQFLPSQDPCRLDGGQLPDGDLRRSRVRRPNRPLRLGPTPRGQLGSKVQGPKPRVCKMCKLPDPRKLSFPSFASLCGSAALREF